MTRSEEEVVDAVEKFLKINFPQIAMHGGEANIVNFDSEEGSLTLKLGGACSGCGISPMTIQALHNRLPQQIPEVDVVHAETEPVDDITAGPF